MSSTNTTSVTNSTRNTHQETPRASPIELQITLIAGLFLILLFLIYAATFYIRWRRRRRTIPVVVTQTTPDLHAITRPRARGVEQSVVDTFPVIGYAAVKIVRTSKSPLECAICLCEFGDEDVLRLLPGCRHVFHTECIGIWLEDHVTCPVCRSNLSDPNVLAGKRLLSMNSEFSDFELSPQISDRESKMGIKEIRRAQSITEGWERYTLTLPDQIVKEIEVAGNLKHRRSTSVQDYTFQGKASWRDGKFRALFKSFSRGERNRDGEGDDDEINMSTVIEGAEASVDTATSSRCLNETLVHGEKYENEDTFVEVNLTDPPIHERV